MEKRKLTEPIYKLTSDYQCYFGGKALFFGLGKEFRLAGLKLSKHSDKSPFHYDGDIIRLPNCILQEVYKDEGVSVSGFIGYGSESKAWEINVSKIVENKG